MKKYKRYAALAAVVLLLIVFCLPMVFAFGSGEKAEAYFRAAFGAAILVPVLLYAMILVYRVLSKKNGQNAQENKNMENIIFDVGQVLVKFDWETYLKSYNYSEEKYEKLADAIFRSNIWNERDRSLLDEEEYIDQMVQTAPEYEADIRMVMKNSAKTISKMDYAETWVKYLKEQGYHLYILSNYSTAMLKQTRSIMSFLKYMDGVVFSCDVKQIKPEEDIYRTLLNRYNLNPGKSVFIDDREENCAAARKEGIHAICFKSFKQAVAELEKLGVK